MTEAKYKNNYILWGALCAAYCAFIFIFSYLYPYGGDEYTLTAPTFGDAIAIFLTSYLVRNPRIGLLFNNIILWSGKWLFLILNPLVQLALIFAIFFLVYLRLPDFKSRKDFYPFALIMLMSVFCAAVPDNTLFWIGGACNYSWMFLVFVLFLCLLRFAAEKGINFNINFPFKLLMFFGGIVVGMSSENNSPMLLILFCVFWLYARYKKIQISSWFYVALAGIICGLALLFGAPGSYYRLKTLPLEYVKTAGLWQKVFWHLPRLNAFFADTLFILPLTALGLGFAAWTDRKNILQDKDFILSSFFVAVSITLAAVLFAVPLLLNRVFYSASLTAVIAFIFMLKYFGAKNNANYFKPLFLLAFCAVFALMPLFSVPYFDLYQKDAQRLRYIQAAKQAGKTMIFMPPVSPLKGPSGNLSINYYDFVYLNNYDKNLIFGLDMESGVKTKLLPLPSENI